MRLTTERSRRMDGVALRHAKRLGCLACHAGGTQDEVDRSLRVISYVTYKLAELEGWSPAECNQYFALLKSATELMRFEPGRDGRCGCPPG